MLQKARWRFDGERPFAWLTARVHKLSARRRRAFGVVSPSRTVARRLERRAEDRLFLFVDAAFTPSPGAPLADLQRCFGTGGELVVHYATIGAYG